MPETDEEWHARRRQTRRASAKFNGDFYSIATETNTGLSIVDGRLPEHVLTPDASDEELGLAVLQALSRSRFVTQEEDPEIFSWEVTKQWYEAWVAQMRAQFGYRSRRALFARMESCYITSFREIMTISPSCHERLEGWGSTTKDGVEKVVIPADASPAEIGAALRLGFERCLLFKPRRRF